MKSFHVTVQNAAFISQTSLLWNLKVVQSAQTLTFVLVQLLDCVRRKAVLLSVPQIDAVPPKESKITTQFYKNLTGALACQSTGARPLPSLSALIRVHTPPFPQSLCVCLQTTHLCSGSPLPRPDTHPCVLSL